METMDLDNTPGSEDKVRVPCRSLVVYLKQGNGYYFMRSPLLARIKHPKSLSPYLFFQILIETQTWLEIC